MRKCTEKGKRRAYVQWHGVTGALLVKELTRSAVEEKFEIEKWTYSRIELDSHEEVVEETPAAFAILRVGWEVKSWKEQNRKNVIVQRWPTRGSRAACGSLPGFMRLLRNNQMSH